MTDDYSVDSDEENAWLDSDGLELDHFTKLAYSFSGSYR